MERFLRVVGAGAALCVSLSAGIACGGGKPVDFYDSAGGASAAVFSSAGQANVAGVNATGASGSDATGASGSDAMGVSGSDAMGVSGSDATGASGSGSLASAGQSGTGNGGGSAGAPSDAPCSPVIDVTGGMSGAFGTTGAVCMRVTADITGWGCSNFIGRTLKVNRSTVLCEQLPLPDKIDGAYYFDISAGSMDYASFYWY